MHTSQKPIDLPCDPLRFVSLCWPDMKLSDKQREILLSVVSNVETFVHAANETGKTRIAAIAAVWFFVSRTPARVVLSSSSETQLETILWSEIVRLIKSSRLPLPFVTKILRIEKLCRPGSAEVEPSDYIIGQVTRMVESFQGHHLPHDRPRVMAIFDEASGVPDEFYEAADSWAHRKLVIGNPLSTSNFFYRHCRAGDLPDPAGTAELFRKVIHIDGRDSPNVQIGMRWNEADRPGPSPVLIPGLLTYDEFLRRRQQWNEVQRTTRLYGSFYEGGQAVLFPAPWLDAAMDPLRWAQLQRQTRCSRAMGVDVAAGGRDNTCWTLIDRLGIIEQIVMDTPNTMEIPGRTIRLMKEHRLPARRVAFDAGGGGKQIADRLREQGHRVLVVGFGESPNDRQAYCNRRAELYGKLRERLNPEREGGGFVLPPNADQLRRELSVLPLQYDSEGRLQLLPKEASGDRQRGPSLRQLLGRSPDRADSLALAVWVLGLRRGAYVVKRPLVWSDGSAGGADLTPEQLARCPKVLRDIIGLHDRRNR